MVASNEQRQACISDAHVKYTSPIERHAFPPRTPSILLLWHLGGEVARSFCTAGHNCRGTLAEPSRCTGVGVVCAAAPEFALAACAMAIDAISNNNVITAMIFFMACPFSRIETVLILVTFGLFYSNFETGNSKLPTNPSFPQLSHMRRMVRAMPGIDVSTLSSVISPFSECITLRSSLLQSWI